MVTGLRCSDSYRIQTCNLLIRSQMLYSVELRSLEQGNCSFCDSYRIQTCNLLIRSQMLYSVELRSLALSQLRLQSYNFLVNLPKVLKDFHTLFFKKKSGEGFKG